MSNEKEEENVMHKLFLSISKMMPEDMLVDQLQDALSNYKEDKTESNRSTLKMYVIMYATRLMTEKDSVGETLNEFDEHNKMLKRNKIINT